MQASILQSYELKSNSILLQSIYIISSILTPFISIPNLPLTPQPSIPVLSPYIMSSPPPTTTKPTILLIHGAWHTPATWDALRSTLHSASYPTLAPALPSSGSLVSSHHDDIAIIRRELERLILSESKQVVLVCHSYGGMVGSGAVAGLEAYRRKAEKKQGGVLHCIFLCAFLVPIGKAVADMEDERPAWHHIDVRFLIASFIVVWVCYPPPSSPPPTPWIPSPIINTNNNSPQPPTSSTPSPPTKSSTTTSTPPSQPPGSPAYNHSAKRSSPPKRSPCSGTKAACRAPT